MMNQAGSVMWWVLLCEIYCIVDNTLQAIIEDIIMKKAYRIVLALMQIRKDKNLLLYEKVRGYKNIAKATIKA